jgi:glutamine cyclotransferase
MNSKLLVIAVILFTACHNTTDNDNINNSSVVVPATMNYTVTNIYPHDSTSFLEGLEWHDGFLYEGSGDPDYIGKSKLAKVDLITGKDVQKINLSKEYFGEGITVLNDKIYELTYKEGKCFVYDLKTFNKIKEFNYDGEGWGMTNDGKYLIMDNKTEKLVYRDPNTFDIVKEVSVTDNNGPLSSINELEYVNGFIYANVWQRDIIVKIDPNTGSVVAKADLSKIWNTAGQLQNDRADVLNGIAYDSTQKRFFITGKNWSKLFEVKFN